MDSYLFRFLLARLYVDSFLNTVDESQVELALDKVSKSSQGPKEINQIYDQAYDDAIKRIESQMSNQIELARKALLWIKDAQRSLTVEELRHALAVKPGDKELNQKSIPKIEVVVSVCAGLVTVDEKSNTVQLVHYTTQEYFERMQLGWHVGAQEEIAMACLTYLSFNTFRSGSCASDEAFEQRIADNVFFDYSVRHWSEHVRPVQRTISSFALGFLCDNLLVDCTIQAAFVIGYKYNGGYSQDFPSLVRGLHLTAMYGLLHLTELLMSMCEGCNVEADSKDIDGRTPLFWAARSGREAIVKLLLDNGKVDPDSKDKDGRTPLLLAAESGREAIVKLLLDIGKAAPDSKDEKGQTPLRQAAANGHEAIAKLLLDTGEVDPDSKDKWGQTPLLQAAESGREAIVKLLLDTGKVNPDWKDKEDRSPLLQAAESGHEAIVKLLLDTGKVDPDSKDKDDRTPLWRAAWSGHDAIVKLLLDTGKVDPDSKDKDGRTPLLLVAWSGHDAIVKLLLDTGKVDPDLKDKHGETPLLLAARSGRETTVKLLLDTGKVDPDLKDKHGETPLLLAARSGRETTVKLLLDTGKV